VGEFSGDPEPGPPRDDAGRPRPVPPPVTLSAALARALTAAAVAVLVVVLAAVVVLGERAEERPDPGTDGAPSGAPAEAGEQEPREASLAVARMSGGWDEDCGCYLAAATVRVRAPKGTGVRAAWYRDGEREEVEEERWAGPGETAEFRYTHEAEDCATRHELRVELEAFDGIYADGSVNILC
jgi:hypothetical protein